MTATHPAPPAGRALARSVVLFGCLGLSCSSASPVHTKELDAGGAALSRGDAGGAQSSPDAGEEGDAGAAIVETGIMVDYETLTPVAGLTVTDNGVSTTTDATGAFTLSVPSTATLLAPTVTGPSYSLLLFPGSSPARGTVEYGTNVIPDSSTYALEQQILQNDQTKALVQIVVQVSGSCSSAVGGSLQVLSPPGTSVRYFSKLNVPDSTLTSFQAVTSPRSVAVVYDIPVGSPLTVAVTHPTCSLVAFPTTSGGKVLTGEVTTKATEPGDVNAALVLMLQ